MEIRQELETIEVDFICPKCKVGNLRPTGKGLMIQPLRYPHKCTECDNQQTFKVRYPYHEFKPKY